MKISIILLAFTLFCSVLSAQEKFIEGTVTTFDSIAVIGANIEVKSSKQVFKTDTLGNFKVKVTTNDKLKIKAKGFTSQTIKLSAKDKHLKIDLKLKQTENAIEYATGYGYVKDKERLNALCQLSNNDNNFSDYSNIYDLIQGQFPGVKVEDNEIIVRETNDLSAMSSSALIIIDGVVSSSDDMEALPLTQIKNINILKDGSTAIYGTRGANGVVVIETKKGGD